MDAQLRTAQRAAARGEPDAVARAAVDRLRVGRSDESRELLHDAARRGSRVALDALDAFGPDLSCLRATARPLKWTNPLPGPSENLPTALLEKYMYMVRTGPRSAVARTVQYHDFRVFDVDLDGFECSDRHRATSSMRYATTLEDGRVVRLDYPWRGEQEPYALEVEQRYNGWRGRRAFVWQHHRRLCGVDYLLGVEKHVSRPQMLVYADWDFRRPVVMRPWLDSRPVGVHVKNAFFDATTTRIGPVPGLWHYQVENELYAFRADRPGERPRLLLVAEDAGRFQIVEMASGDLLVAETRGGYSPALQSQLRSHAFWTKLQETVPRSPFRAPATRRAPALPTLVDPPAVRFWRVPYLQAEQRWDAAVLLGSLNGTLEGKLALWPDGRHVLCFVDCVLRVIDARAGAIAHTQVRANRPGPCVFAPDGSSAWWLTQWPDSGTGRMLRLDAWG